MVAEVETSKLYIENAELVKQNASMKMEIASLSSENKWLKEQLGLARKQRFGS